MARIQDVQNIVWEFYDRHGRALPWRVPEADGSFSGYKILVSEIMLQQTQVTRVILKYQEFLRRFPDLPSLAQASLADVLEAWSGLGYNRRAKYLHQTAQHLLNVTEPWTVADLVACPGVGRNTAAAVCVYAYNQSMPFIETNIRTVFIHHFFADQAQVSDAELWPLITAAWDTENAREFGWALMDYGNHLKKTVGNAAQRSKHYAKQSKFEGSLRQIRGQVLRLLLQGSLSAEALDAHITDERLPAVLSALQSEGFIERHNEVFRLREA